MDHEKFVIIGEAPGPSAKIESHSPMFPLPKGTAGAKMLELTGLSRGDYCKIARVNVVPVHPKLVDAKAFRAIAKWSARGLMRGGLLRGKSVFLLGQKVQEAFNLKVDPLEWVGPFESRLAPFRQVCVVPHPSGLNRFWNDEENVERAKEFLSEAFNSV